MIYPINQEHKSEKLDYQLQIQRMKDVTREFIAHLFFTQFYLLAKILYLFLLWRNHQEFKYLFILPSIDLLNFIQNIRELVYIIKGDLDRLENYREGQPLILDLFYFDFDHRLIMQQAVQYKFFTMTWLIFISYLGSIIYGIFSLAENYTADKIENFMIFWIIITSLNLILKFLMALSYYYEKKIYNKQNIKYKLQRYVDCSICLAVFKEGEELRQLQCIGKHIFHQRCIESWLKYQKTCPNCISKPRDYIDLIYREKINNYF